MSRTIDMSQGLDALEDDEILYLFARDQVELQYVLDRGLNPNFDPSGPIYLQNQPNYGDANTKAATPESQVPPEDYEDDLGPKYENLTKPQLVGVDDDEADLIEVPDNNDYGNWKVDQLQAELADRKLPPEGKKKELVARLQESDARGYGKE